ncbi:MAG: hypothetical protein ABI691_17965 [Ginsengibacter sp.]
MKQILLVFITIFTSFFSFAQQADKIINATEVERIEKILSADDMQGRKTFTPGIDKAADFIAAEFKKSNLQFFGNNTSYFQEFTMSKAKPVEVSGMLGDDSLTINNVAANTTMEELNINSLKDYEVVVVKKDDDFSKVVFPIFDTEKNVIVLVDTAHTRPPFWSKYIKSSVSPHFGPSI